MIGLKNVLLKCKFPTISNPVGALFIQVGVPDWQEWSGQGKPAKCEGRPFSENSFYFLSASQDAFSDVI